MKIAVIFKTEANTNIYLHNEGLFWRAYDIGLCFYKKYKTL